MFPKAENCKSKTITNPKRLELDEMIRVTKALMVSCFTVRNLNNTLSSVSELLETYKAAAPGMLQDPIPGMGGF